PVCARGQMQTAGRVGGQRLRPIAHRVERVRGLAAQLTVGRPRAQPDVDAGIAVALVGAGEGPVLAHGDRCTAEAAAADRDLRVDPVPVERAAGERAVSLAAVTVDAIAVVAQLERIDHTVAAKRLRVAIPVAVAVTLAVSVAGLAVSVAGLAVPVAVTRLAVAGVGGSA